MKVSMNRKASSMMIYGLIIGFTLFMITALAFGNGLRHALSGYKVSQQSLNKLTEAMTEISKESANIKLLLVDSEFDEDMAIYIFNKDTEGMFEYYSTEADPRWDGSTYDLSDSNANNNVGIHKRVIEKPLECSNAKGICVCLCKEFDVEGPNYDEATKKKFGKEYYPQQGDGFAVDFYRLDCGNLECYILENVNFQDYTDLKDIVDEANYKRIQDASDKYVFEWEDGFSIWRSEEEPYNQLIPIKYADLYVVANNDYTIGICLDPGCIANN